MNNNIKDKLSAALNKAAKNAPVSEVCPLIKNPKWNCRPHDKGSESFCKSITGYTGCLHYQRWFHWVLAKAIATEIVSKNEVADKAKKK